VGIPAHRAAVLAWGAPVVRQCQGIVHIRMHAADGSRTNGQGELAAAAGWTVCGPDAYLSDCLRAQGTWADPIWRRRRLVPRDDHARARAHLQQLHMPLHVS